MVPVVSIPSIGFCGQKAPVGSLLKPIFPNTLTATNGAKKSLGEWLVMKFLEGHAKLWDLKGKDTNSSLVSYAKKLHLLRQKYDLPYNKILKLKQIRKESLNVKQWKQSVPVWAAGSSFSAQSSPSTRKIMTPLPVTRQLTPPPYQFLMIVL